MINIGSDEVSSIYIGGTQVKEVWYGSDKMWPQESDAPGGDVIDPGTSGLILDSVLDSHGNISSDTSMVVIDYLTVNPGPLSVTTAASGNNVMWVDYNTDKSYDDYWTTGSSTDNGNGTKTRSRSYGKSVLIRVNCQKQFLQYCKVENNGTVIFDGSKYSL